jgi:hypothetical protein
MVQTPIVLHGISILFLLLFFFFNKIKRDNLVNVSLVLLLGFLFAIVFIQRDYDLNIDLPRYMAFYPSHVSLVDVFTSETAWKGDFLFFSLMPLAHFLGLGPTGYISFQLIIGLTLVFLGYHLYYRNRGGLVFLGLFFMVNSSSTYLIHGNVIRQGFASAMLILSLSRISDKGIIWSYLAAFFSHKGSMFAFFERFIKIKKVYVKLLVLICALLIGYFDVFIHILRLLPLPGFIEDKLAFYTSFERASTNSVIKLMLLLVFNLIFLFLRFKDGTTRRTYNLFFMFSIAAFLLYPFDGMFSRLVLYTDIFLPFLTIGLITSFQDRKHRNMLFSIAVLSSLAYSYYVFGHESILFNMGEYFQLW